MSIFDDGSNTSLLHAAFLLFITGAALSAIRAVRNCEPNADLGDCEDLPLIDPWGVA